MDSAELMWRPYAKRWDTPALCARRGLEGWREAAERTVLPNESGKNLQTGDLLAQMR